jgi:glutathione-regulated potassium-efflux system ancillary protein KefC
MEHDTSWLQTSLVYLAAAVVAVPLSRLLGLGSVIGYLAAGVAIGPWGLGLVTDAITILHVAEFGVVLMMFLVGLELEPRRLWAMRRPIFGWGSVQLFGSAALLAGIAVACGVDWRIALVASLGLADSSTATGLGIAAERNLLPTNTGQRMLGVLLLQDVAAIPILALIPLLAIAGTHTDGNGWITAAKAVGVIAAIVFGGRLLLRPALRWIARSDSPEIFTAASLLLVVAIAALMHSVGLSMALGAFLAGVLLAESEYRRELETDIEPFKGLLLGLFFIAVGMTIDFAVIAAQPGLVAAIVIGLLVVKALVLWGIGRATGMSPGERPLFIVLLAQGGEMGFVIFQAAAGAGVIDAPTSSLLTAAVTLSMLVAPLLLIGADRMAARYAAAPTRRLDEIAEHQDAPVIIAGFGRYGQIIGRMLSANGLQATVLDYDVEQIETVRRFGWKAFYGDATRLDLLRVAGAGRARVFVLAIDDVEQSVEVAKLVREHFPSLSIVARARNVGHYYRLAALGVTLIERETLDSALMSARSVLEQMGWERHAARTQALRFRRHSIELMERMAPHSGDEKRLIALSKEGRRQLEAQWAQERSQRQGRGDWQAPDSEERPDARST